MERPFKVPSKQPEAVKDVSDKPCPNGISNLSALRFKTSLISWAPPNIQNLGSKLPRLQTFNFKIFGLSKSA